MFPQTANVETLVSLKLSNSKVYTVKTEQLKNSLNKTIADRFENVSVLFADIVNFTELADSVSAEEIVESLNVLFSLFDERAKNSGIEKIKTIGDAYMAVCGLPEPDSAYAVKIVNFA